MDKEQKTLKSPLSAKFDSCDECKAKVACEAQKSLAREIIHRIECMEPHANLIVFKKFFLIKHFLEQIIG